MRKNIWWILAVAVVLILAAFQACGGGEATVVEVSVTMAPTDTPAPTPSPTPEPTNTPEPTDTPAPTDTPEPTEAPADTPAPESGEKLVWIPTNGGTKYHSKPTCSQMIDPEQVTVSEAAALGFEPCKRCYG